MHPIGLKLTKIKAQKPPLRRVPIQFSTTLAENTRLNGPQSLQDCLTLIHIQNAYTQSLKFIRSASTFPEFLKNRRLVSAILYQTMIIGEAAKRLSPEFMFNNPQLPWRELMKMRNKIHKDFTHIPLDTIYKNIHRQGKPAIHTIENWLQQLDPSLKEEIAKHRGARKILKTIPKVIYFSKDFIEKLEKQSALASPNINSPEITGQSLSAIKDALKRGMGYVKNMNQESFLRNPEVQSAVINEMLIVRASILRLSAHLIKRLQASNLLPKVKNGKPLGESFLLSNEVPENLRLSAILPNVPWNDFEGFGRHLIHRFEHVDLNIVWSAITNVAPKTLQQIKALLTQMNHGKIPFPPIRTL